MPNFISLFVSTISASYLSASACELLSHVFWMKKNAYTHQTREKMKWFQLAFHNSVQCAFTCYLAGLALFHFCLWLGFFFYWHTHKRSHKCICIYNSIGVFFSISGAFALQHPRRFVFICVCVLVCVSGCVEVNWLEQVHQCLFYCGEAKWRIDDAIFRKAILICSQRTFWHIVFACAMCMWKIYAHNILCFFFLISSFFPCRSASTSSSFFLNMHINIKMRTSHSITKRNRLPEYKIILLYFLVAFSCYSFFSRFLSFFSSLFCDFFSRNINIVIVFATVVVVVFIGALFGMRSDFPHRNFTVCLFKFWMNSHVHSAQCTHLKQNERPLQGKKLCVLILVWNAKWLCRMQSFAQHKITCIDSLSINKSKFHISSIIYLAKFRLFVCCVMFFLLSLPSIFVVLSLCVQLLYSVYSSDRLPVLKYFENKNNLPLYGIWQRNLYQNVLKTATVSVRDWDV